MPIEDYAIYLRKSRADAEAELRGEGETLARHRAQLTDLALKRGLNVVATYEEIVSGDTIEARPQMQRLLNAVRAGAYRGVLVMEVERLARGDTVDQGIVAQIFRATGTLIVTPYRTYDPTNELDEDYFEFSLFMARREYKAITRRMQAGRAASVREGKYVGTRKVYGYQRVKLQGQKGWSLQILPEEARIVRLIFDWYAHGMDGHKVGMDRIAGRLNQMGVLAPRGGAWTRSSVYNILTCEILRGCVTWQKRTTAKSIGGQPPPLKYPKNPNPIIVKGLHEPIIDDVTFAAVKQILSNNRPVPATHGAPLANPLAGLVHCALCGKTMTLKQGGTPGGSNCYQMVACPTKGCKTTAIRLTIVEDAILDVLRLWQRQYATGALQDPDADTDAAALRTLRATVADAKKQMERVYTFLEKGIYSEQVFFTRRAALEATISQATAQIETLTANSDQKASSITRLLPQVKTVLDLYAQAPTATEKNRLLKMVISTVKYHKTIRCYRNQDPAQHLSIDVYPVIPD